MTVTGSVFWALVVGINRVQLPKKTSAQYFPHGPQANILETKVFHGGWTKCHSEPFRVRQNAATLDSIQKRCSRKKFLMACRKSGSSVLTLLAAAPNCPEALNVTDPRGHVINGSKWYRVPNKSYGFAPANCSVSLHSADTKRDLGHLRLSYHLTGSTGGWRCGNNKKLNRKTDWERLYYHAD